jgi:hypothetical protein
VIDLSSLVTVGDTFAFEFAFGSDGCNGALGTHITLT